MSTGNDTAGLLAIANGTGYRFIPADDIIYCEVQGTYCKLVTHGGSFAIGKSLKTITATLSGAHFVRVHHSMLVNVQHAVQFSDNGEMGLVMSNGDKVPVSRRRRKELLGYFTQL